MMDKVRSVHYFPLPSQGNIYCLTTLQMSNGVNKILVATLRRKIYSFEFSTDATGLLKPILREVQFTYIPSGAEIISIDAFSKSETTDDFVIGITIIKAGEHTAEAYLNIYSEWEPSSEFNLESVAQNCHMIELNFVPHHLIHTELTTWPDGEKNKEIVWLLSGNDRKVHLYREDKENHCYSEAETTQFFPEFTDAPSIIYWIDVYHTSDQKRRLSAYSCECGHFQVSIVEVSTIKVIASWSAARNYLVSGVRFYPDRTIMKSPSFVDLTADTEPNTSESSLKVNLVVTEVVKACVYLDVMQYGLKKRCPLPNSDNFDAITCSLIADTDFDGKPEVILGTFGQEMLVYKFDENEEMSNQWKLVHKCTFAHPIYSMLHLDLTGDGVREYVILTQKGVDILQHDPKDIKTIFDSRFKSIKLKPNVVGKT